MATFDNLTVEEVIRVLENVQGGSGQYNALCPAHVDTNNSLSIGTDANGHATVHCFSGCDAKSIFSVVRELLDKPNKQADRPSAIDDFGKHKKEPEAIYFYVDASGVLLAEKRRFRKDDGNKTFFWRRKDEAGHWINSVRGIDIPLYNLPAILSSSGPVFIVEGEKDVDTMTKNGLIATCNHDGAGKWKQAYNTSLLGKDVVIVQDNDTPGKKHAHMVARNLANTAASLKIVDLTIVDSGLPDKGDFTDYIERGGTLPAFLDLVNRTECFSSEIAASNAEHPYSNIFSDIYGFCIDSHGQLCQEKETSNGYELAPLMDGAAIITEEITKDDGQNITKHFNLEGITGKGRKLHVVCISADSFESMSWIPRNWGVDLVLTPGQTTKGKLTAALYKSGQSGGKRTVYAHTGFKKLDEQPIFLHGSGAIGYTSGIEVELDKALSRYEFSGHEENYQDDIRMSLRLLTAHQQTATYPLFAFVYLAPLYSLAEEAIGSPPAFAMYLQAPTQAGKTTLAALACSHFGRFTDTTPPTNFTSTANFIQKMTFEAKDVLLWVDDHHPRSTRYEAQAQDNIFQTILRGAGDRASRGRMKADRSLDVGMPPRGLVLMTGEDMPEVGQSGIARMFTLCLEKKREDITMIQAAAANGTVNRAMRGYIEYLIADYDNVRERIRSLFSDYRRQSVNWFADSSRLSTNCSWLFVGAHIFSDYALSQGVFNGSERDEFLKTSIKLICETAKENERAVQEEDPVRLYVEALRDAVQVIPFAFQNCVLFDSFTGLAEQGIGWQDSTFYYLDPARAYSYVLEHYRLQDKRFPVSKNEIHKRLTQKGIIEPGSNGKSSKVKCIAGQSKRVLFVPKNKIDEVTQ